MRRMGIRIVGAVALLVVLAGLGSGPASAAGNRKLVEGTVYDTTCATACLPECPPPPHCGPITADSSAAIVCPQTQKRIIACPLVTKRAEEASTPVCLPESSCLSYPVYSGEGATVNVRRRGSAKVIASLPVIEGHFRIRLGPGEYVIHPYLAEESCWSGEATMATVWAQYKGPIPISVDVHDSCVAHPSSE